MSQNFNHKHLLGIAQLSKEDIYLILDTAKKYVELNREKKKKQDILKGLTQINLFFENSTRTRTSFELAGKRLSADVINMSVSSSAIKKGETLIDTAMTLNAMHPDFIVVRHPESGAVQLLADKVNCSVINAGDGMHEHPTQALLDVLTIQLRGKEIEGLTVAICGDIINSRVARSNIILLQKLGAKVRVVAPTSLMPYKPECLGVEAYTNIKEGIKNTDIIMMLRLQTERMNEALIPSVREYFSFYGLSYETLKYANENALVMHPGPINRGVEIDTDIADDINRSVILNQVEMGVAVRQAVLDLLSQ